MQYRIVIFSIAILLLWGCSASKQLIKNVPVKTEEKAVYQASYTKTTDIIHTKLDIKFDWDSAFVIGKAQIEVKPYFYPLNQVVLDAKGFKINQVFLVEQEEEIPLKYSYNGKLLTIDLDRTYQQTQKFSLLIDYVAMPNQLKVGIDIPSEECRGLYFINRDRKEKKPRQIWTQGETEYNSCWFPTIDGPQEKMTQEVNITVPDSMTTLSNGFLDFSITNPNGTRTDYWRQELPHSTYLTMLAVGNFDVVKDMWQDKEVSYYVEPAFSANAKLIFGKTPEMMEFFSQKTGVTYPWDKYAQIVVRDFPGGAMENTTATVFFEQMNMTEGEYLDENYEDIISHELFHHWFGDLVTAESWSNLPLNESFATYGEYLWNEYKYGRDFADYKLMLDRDAYIQDSTNKTLDVIRFDYLDREQMFDKVTYQKGGQILHMLRKLVGDGAFFQSLNLYLARYAYKTAEIHDLRLVFEEVTGQDLNWFFNQWFLASGHPELSMTTDYDAYTKQIVINIEQKQEKLYQIPMLVDMYRGNQVERKSIVLEKRIQTFVFPAEGVPDLVNIDAEKSVLAEKKELKTLNQYIHQYKYAPLFMDRYEAITQLIKHYAMDKSTHQVMMDALKDKNWYIRTIALKFIPNLDVIERNQLYDKVKEIAVHDERSYVRASAIKILKQIYTDRDHTAILEKAMQDKAPSVQRATLGT